MYNFAACARHMASPSQSCSQALYALQFLCSRQWQAVHHPSPCELQGLGIGKEYDCSEECCVGDHVQLHSKLLQISGIKILGSRLILASLTYATKSAGVMPLLQPSQCYPAGFCPKIAAALRYKEARISSVVFSILCNQISSTKFCKQPFILQDMKVHFQTQVST